MDVFKNSNSNMELCVSPNYKCDSFCGVNVSSSEKCKQFNLFNHCYIATAQNDGELIQQKRKNATLFENRTNGCVKYQCNNEVGPISWSLCNSTDIVTRM